MTLRKTLDLLLPLLIILFYPTLPELTMDTIFHLNTRSIRNKLSRIMDFADGINILCFTETHLSDDVPTSDLLLDNYEVPFRLDRTNHGGGILVYIMNGILANRRTDLENDVDEILWFEIILKSSKYLISVVYRPPNTQQQFWSRLERSISLALDETNYLLVLGDLNVDFFQQLPQPFHDMILTKNLNNIITEPTRICSTRQSLLDPILFSDSIVPLEHGTLPVENTISDHEATFAAFKTPTGISQSYTREIWLYSKANIDSLKHDIRITDWNTLLTEVSFVDEACNKFTEETLKIAHKHIPTKTVTIRKNDKPWCNSEIRKSIRKRNRLRKKAIKTKSATYINKYKQERNKVTQLKRKAREKYYLSLEENINHTRSNNPKTYWKLMKTLIKTKSTGDSMPPLRTNETSINDCYAFTNFEKCELLKSYFCSISNIDETSVPLPQFEDRSPTDLQEILISKEEIEDIIKNLDSKKAKGPDNISHSLLKLISSEISIPLEILFNRSLNEGCFPNMWKLAHVIPIFKKGDKSLPSNYRPISLLSCVGKIFERVVFKHMYNYLHTNNLIYKYQSGFIPGHSTVHQLIEIYNSICLSLDSHEHYCITFCDISKAFDRVWIKGLLLKLEKYGFTGKLHSWLSSYLTSRKIKVVLNNAISSEGDITAGVPQGSVLGPLLFLVYVNDIADELTSLTRLFADDTSVGSSSMNLNRTIMRTNCDLDKISKWARKWLVKFNPSKTDIMVFSNINLPFEPIFQFENNMINTVKEHKHLGLTFQSNGKWTEHINSLIKSASKLIGMLRKIKYLLKRDSLSTLYISFIRPILEYGSEVWDGCSLIDSERLEKVQLEAARIVTGLPIYASKNSLYYETGWETLYTRRKNKKLRLLYQIINGNAPDYLLELIPPIRADVTRYQLRNSNQISIPNASLEIYKHSFIPSTIRLWNELEVTVRQSSSISVFKKQISARNLPPIYFSKGKRLSNILHTKLRHNCSALNSDLYRVNIKDTPQCSCGAHDENSEHYFMFCPKYNAQRGILFNSLRGICQTFTLNTLLFGDEDFSLIQNENIFQAVQLYITETKRF